MIVLSLFGFGDSDIDADADDFGDSPEFPILTIKNLLAFLAMFSWVGMLMISLEFSLPTVIIVAFIAASIFVFIISGIYFIMNSLKQITDSSVEQTVGNKGIVYLKVSAKGGQIITKINGSMQIIDAMISGNEILDVGETVEIIGVVNPSTVEVTWILK